MNWSQTGQKDEKQEEEQGEGEGKGIDKQRLPKEAMWRKYSTIEVEKQTAQKLLQIMRIWSLHEEMRAKQKSHIANFQSMN